VHSEQDDFFVFKEVCISFIDALIKSILFPVFLIIMHVMEANSLLSMSPLLNSSEVLLNLAKDLSILSKLEICLSLKFCANKPWFWCLKSLDSSDNKSNCFSKSLKDLYLLR